jgi:hypothetical protein
MRKEEEKQMHGWMMMPNGPKHQQQNGFSHSIPLSNKCARTHVRARQEGMEFYWPFLGSDLILEFFF